MDETTKAVVITAGIIASLLFPSLARKLLKDAIPEPSVTTSQTTLFDTD